MGRIDEALRRSGFAGRRQVSVDADFFVSPWPVEGEERPTRPALSPAPPPDRQVFDEPSDVRSGRESMLDRLSPSWRDRLVIGPRANAVLGEQFRRLAATLVDAQRSQSFNCIMVTSPLPGDGKTLTALNLALVLGDSYGRRVLLIESDLRRPALTEALGLGSIEGLTAAITRGEDRKISVVQLTTTVSLLPAGRAIADPLAGLTSLRLQHIVEDARARYDWVILDTPPVTAAADAELLAPLVDGTLLVVRANKTPFKALQKAIKVIGDNPIIGVVLNGVGQDSTPVYQSYHSDLATTNS
jgi:capsular exopolysaccharide synthesis family protein